MKYSYDPQFWEDWETNLLSSERRGKKVQHPSESTEDYLGWFHTVSHPFACNPDDAIALPEDERTLVSVSPLFLLVCLLIPLLTSFTFPLHLTCFVMQQRNRRALDAALRFRGMPKESVTSDNAFEAIDEVIACLSGVMDVTETETTTTRSGRTTSSISTDVRRKYSRKAKGKDKGPSVQS